MADSLFDIAFQGYMTPLRAEGLKAETDLRKVQVQAETVNLQNQMAAQQRMQSIWGPNALTQLNNAVADPTQAALPKLIATAQTYFATGNPQAGAQLMNSISLMGYRNVEQQKALAGVQTAKIKQVSSALAGVTDQASYQDALNTLEAEGIAPESIGLTTDYEANQGRIANWVASGKTAHQQTLEDFNEEKLASTDAWRGMQFGIMQQRLEQGAKRIQQQQDALNQRTVMDTFRQKEAAIHDARAQEALEMKNLGKDARGYLNASRVQKPELKLAQDMFSLSDMTKDMPENLRNTYAAMAAMRAKQMVADKMKASGDSEYTQEDFDTAMNEVMVDFKNQGLFTPNQQGGGLFSSPGYGFQQPKARAPVAPSKPTGNPKDPTSYKDAASLTRAIQAGIVVDQAAVDAYAKKMGWTK